MKNYSTKVLHFCYVRIVALAVWHCVVCKNRPYPRSRGQRHQQISTNWNLKTSKYQ